MRPREDVLTAGCTASGTRSSLGSARTTASGRCALLRTPRTHRLGVTSAQRRTANDTAPDVDGGGAVSRAERCCASDTAHPSARRAPVDPAWPTTTMRSLPRSSTPPRWCCRVVERSRVVLVTLVSTASKRPRDSLSAPGTGDEASAGLPRRGLKTLATREDPSYRESSKSSVLR